MFLIGAFPHPTVFLIRLRHFEKGEFEVILFDLADVVVLRVVTGVAQEAFEDLSQLFAIVRVENELVVSEATLDSFGHLVAEVHLIRDRYDPDRDVGFTSLSGSRKQHENSIVAQSVHLVQRDEGSVVLLVQNLPETVVVFVGRDTSRRNLHAGRRRIDTIGNCLDSVVLSFRLCTVDRHRRQAIVTSFRLVPARSMT